MSQNDPAMLAREYSTSERLERRRTNVTGWLRGETDAWDEALAAVAEARPQRVLDAGCGDGLFARLVAAPVVVGVDRSHAMVARARERGVDARLGDIQDLPFDDGEFDVVVCNWTLYHLQDLDRGLAEIARVLRPGGRFVGIYNRDRHMEELWSRVHPEFADADAFDEPLARHFAHVELRNTTAYTLWETRDELQAYVDAFVEMIGSAEAPDGPYPFKATRRNCVYVALTEPRSGRGSVKTRADGGLNALEAVRSAIRAVDEARGELGDRPELMHLRGKLMQIRVLLERRP